MNSSAIYSKSGKGVQEASGKTSLLSRADRSVLSAIDGRATLGEVAQKCGKAFDAAFEQLIAKLDKDGFVREVSAGVAPPAPKPPPKPAAKPAGKQAAPSSPGEDLDFSSNLDFSAVPTPKSKAAPPPHQPQDPRAAAEAEKRAVEQASSLVRARQEAEARAQKDRDRIKAEAEIKLRIEAEARLRAEAAAKGQADIEAKLRAESEAKVKAAREAAVRAAADAKAKAEAEAKSKIEAERQAREAAERKAKEEAERVKQEAERARKEAEEKAHREAEELRRKLEEERARAEAERKAREAAERKAKEEAERARKEAEEKARAEAEAMRKQLEEERRKLEEERKREAEARKHREEEDRKRREDEDRKRREEDERRRKEDEARRQREEEARAKEAEDRRRREAEERERREADERERAEAQSKVAKAAATTAPRIEIPPPPPPTPPASAAGSSGSFDAGLLADLDSFGKREEEELKAKEEAERQARAAAERKRRDEEERQAREASERRRREEEERRREEEEARHAREEEERRAREDEEQERRAADERKRRAKETLASAQQAKAPADDEDIGVTDDDLDMDDVKQDQRALSATARREAREREAREREHASAEPAHAEPAEIAAPRSRRKPLKLGKLIGIGLAVVVVGGLAALQFMPLSTGDYEKAASAALGRPVRIASAHFSIFSGMQIAFRGVVVDDVKLGAVSASPELGSLFGERKAFNRIDLESPVLSEGLMDAALFGKSKGGNFIVRRVVAHKLKLQSSLALPPLDADLAFGDEGALRTGTLSGPDGLSVTLTPKGTEIEFDLSSGQFTLPVAPEITLSTFAMKGTASEEGMRVTSWDAALLEGRIAGTANLKWGSTWAMEGAVTVRGINAAVFAPTLLVEGKADGTGHFSSSASAPEKLGSAGRVEGNFTIGRGILGSVDLSRAIQSGGRQATGSTPFSEINGQGTYDKGAVSLRNVSIAAGNLNAGAAADVTPNGALSGRIVADVKTPSATLRATVNLGGTVKEPQVR